MRIVIATLLFLATVQAALAQANIVNVSANPGELRINPNGSTTVSIRWRITLNFIGGAPETITSTFGTTGTGDNIGRPLSRTVSSNGGTKTVTIVESLHISRSIAELIGRTGPGTYDRIFGTSLGTSPQTIALRPSSGGELAFRNVELTFDDGSRSRTVPVGAPLSARLNVTSLGRGQFSGVWQIAGPTGSTTFRPVARTSQRLSGSRRTVFESPALDTRQPGIYRVRFVPENVRVGRDNTPVHEISYTVTRSAGGATAGIRLLSPEPGHGVDSAIRFSWEPYSGASRYRLEFSSPGAVGLATNSLAAVEVAGTSARLKPFTIRRLNSEQNLMWQVVAFDSSGNRLAASPLRQLR